jgi:hypothetical protein
MSEIGTRVAIVGGGVGAVAAALACGRAGVPCVLIEPTAWIGGQLTSQAVPPDENPWVEDFGATASYRTFRRLVREMPGHGIVEPFASDPLLNPGGGWVSRLCCSPARAHQALRTMLAPFMVSGTVRVMTEHELLSVGTDGDRVIGIVVKDASGDEHAINADFYLDATETGDLYELADIEHAIGSDAQSTYGEMHAPEKADERDQQPITWCFALEHHAGEDHTITKPDRYDFWRRYVPDFETPWTGRLFDWTVPSHNESGKLHLPLVPWPDEPAGESLEMWRYRRIVDASKHDDGRPDVSLINVVQTDYWHSPTLGVSSMERDAAYAGAREQSQAFLYWMQTDAPRHDRGTGYPGLKLRGDELGTDDGFAMAPYIREPRRLLARTMLTEAHLGFEQRTRDGAAGMAQASEPGHGSGGRGVGEAFRDSVGIGHYPIDLHPSCSGRSQVYVQACPYRIPMGSLIPQRVRNVLASGKAMGVTHIANGATRLHPVEWAAGEAAGTLAAWCIAHEHEPQHIHQHADLIEAVQAALQISGVPMSWPWESSL